MRYAQYSKLLVLPLLLLSSTIQAMNILLPDYSPILRPDFDGSWPVQLAVFAEGGMHDTAFNCHGDRTSALQIWNGDQNGLAMLDGFADLSTIGQKRAELDADDNGMRGHFLVNGDLRIDASAELAARWFALKNWSFDCYFALYAMRLKDVCWQDLTRNLNDQDARTHQLLTDNFAQEVCQLGGLDIGGWRRVGPSDLTLMVQWFNDFEQAKQILKNVRINWRLGLMFPTGLRRDEDKIFALPFGNDGAFGLPFGLGIELTLGPCFKAGIDVQLMHIFGNTRLRRIKTAPGQTDLLFLQKAEAYKDFGITQRFNLYAELHRISYGLSIRMGYQYYKHGDDTLALKSNQFSTQIANTAPMLEEFTMHQILAKINYDFGYHWDDGCVRPQVALYARVPFNGKRAALTTTIGTIISFDF